MSVMSGMQPSGIRCVVATSQSHVTSSCRVEGGAARERYDRYGGGLFPVAWYDLQRFFAARLPPGVLQVASAFERYEPGGAGSPVAVHLRVRAD